MRPSVRASALGTRLTFFIAGLTLSCWAPLTPFAKARLGVDDAVFGLLLLCLGGGSVAAMLGAGWLSARHGVRPIIIAAAFGIAATLPLLAVAGAPLTLGLALLAFGACMGAFDVSINIHATQVEREAGRPLMSGFHALFSIGGFVGAGLATLLLSLRLTPLQVTLACAGPTLVLILAAAPRLLAGEPAKDGAVFVLPRGVVLLLALLAAITFLVEGAILDWGALLTTRMDLVSVAQGGLSYALFSVAMTVGRLSGDRVTARLGDRRVLQLGGVMALAGFAVLLLAPVAIVAMSGFVLIGLGAANIVPVLFRRAAAQTIMPPALAISAMSTIGYGGILAGPAAVGLVAHQLDLRAAFWALAILLALVPLLATWVAPAQS